MSKHSHLLLALAALLGASLSQATITGYSNTLSSYVASATGVTSTYSFVPLSGIDKAFRTIRITNQGFSSASSPLTATCSNIISNPTAAVSTAAGASQTATFSFQTSTDLTVAASGKISLTFPDNLVTAVASSTSCEIVPKPTTASVTDSSGLTANKIIVVEVKADLAAGKITVTCSGLTLKARAASSVVVDPTTSALSGGISIKTSVDQIAANVGTPAVGSVVAALNALTLSKAVGSSGVASVSFMISSPFSAHASDNKITLTFPSGLVIAQNANLCAIENPATAKTTSSFSNDKVILVVTSDLSAGQITITCSGLTIAAKAAVTATESGTDGLKIETSTDTVPAYVSTPAVGAITGGALTMSKAVGAGGVATISFITSSNLDQSSANGITITFPSGLVTAQDDNLCGITSSQTQVTSTFVNNVITMKFVATAKLAAGAVTVTCTGLTLAAKEAVAATATTGLKIETNKDTVAAFVSVPAVGAIVANTASALTLSSAVGTTGTATISFTTSTPITAHATDNKVTLTFPAGLVTAGTGCAISSPTTAAGTAAYSSNAITITLGATSTLAAGAVTVTCTGLTLAAQAAVAATPAPAATISGVAIAGTAGEFTCTATTLAVGNLVTISGTLGGTGTITGYTSPTTYRVSAITGSGSSVTGFTLKTTADVAIVTTAGTPTGLTYAARSDGLKIETNKDTVAAVVSVPAVGAVSVSYVSRSSFSASLASDKTLDITSIVDVWTASSAPVVTCTVGTFTNAAVTSSQSSRSLLQANQVQISAINSANNVVGTVSSTGQTFPASVPAPPTRNLYLPKALASSYGTAWVIVALSILLLWI